MDREITATARLACDTYANLLNTENFIASKLGLPKLDYGIITLRDENRIRENELFIEHFWTMSISKSLSGWFTIFRIKFRGNTYRNHSNPAKLITGICHFADNKNDLYTETILEETEDEFLNLLNFNISTSVFGEKFIEPQKQFNLHIAREDINTFISVKTPQTDGWKAIEDFVFAKTKQIITDQEVFKNYFELIVK